jgi:hypothetical protein
MAIHRRLFAERQMLAATTRASNDEPVFPRFSHSDVKARRHQMRTLTTLGRLTMAAAGIVAVLAPAPLGAQPAAPGSTAPPDLKKWDATGTIGWHNRPIDAGLYRMRVNSLSAGATLGRYWTENVKTEVEVGTAGTAEGVYWDESSRSTPYSPPAPTRVSNTQVGAAQLYQFFHNAWFHPFVGVGAVFERERLQASRNAQQITVYSYSNGTAIPQVVSIPAWSKRSSDSRVSGFVLAGFKSYVSRHAFFRGDFRLTFRSGVQTTNARIGFGLDF